MIVTRSACRPQVESVVHNPPVLYAHRMIPVQEHDSVARLVGHNVRIELAKKRWSGNRAAHALGWTQQYLSRRTTGTQPFDVEELARVAGLLDIEPAEFMHRVMKSTD